MLCQLEKHFSQPFPVNAGFMPSPISITSSPPYKWASRPLALVHFLQNKNADKLPIIVTAAIIRPI